MATPDFCPARKRRSARPLGEVMLTTQAGTTVTQAIVFCGLFLPQEPTYAAGARHSQAFNGDSGLLPGAQAPVRSVNRTGHFVTNRLLPVSPRRLEIPRLNDRNRRRIHVPFE